MMNLLWEQLKDPFLMIMDPQKRIYWGCMLGSLVIIALHQRHKPLENIKTFFSPAIWLHRSSFMDIKIIIINSFFRYLFLPSQVVLVAALAAVISLSISLIIPKPEAGLLPAGIMIGCYSICSFIADDWSRYYLHKLQHKSSFLWEFHKVHHSAEVLTPLTLYRTHPMDIFCSRMRGICTHGAVTGVFFFLFGDALTAWDILGTSAIGFLFNFFGANLRHSHVWLDFGFLERFFISPAAHQVHHSAAPEDYDTNFGSFLAIWDIWGGSHRDPRRRKKTGVVMGLDKKHDGDFGSNLLDIYLQPFVKIGLFNSQRLKSQTDP